MARTVFDEGDQVCIRGLHWFEVIQSGTDLPHHFKIRQFLSSANVVCLPRNAAIQHGTDTIAMIGNIEPIAHVLAVAIDRQRRALEGIENHKRNQLLRELAWAVVVGAVSGEYWQTVRVVVGPYQMIRSGLRR